MTPTAAPLLSRRLYEAILSSTPDFVYVFDLDHRFTYANDALLKTWGRTRDDAIGKTCLELGYEPWHAAMHDREIDQVVATGQPVRGEVPFTGTFGRRVYDYILVPVIGADGEAEAVAETTRDVTENRQAAQALKESEERFREAARRAGQLAAATAKFRAFFEQASNFAGVLEIDGTVVEANRLSLDSCGFTREEILGKPYWECGWWNRSPKLQELIRHACREAAAGRLFRTETNYFCGDGSERYVDLIVAPVIGDDGTVLFLAPSGVDITERKRTEEDLRKQTERIRLLWEAASVLLTTEQPDAMMRGLFAKIAPHFGLDSYFNFMVDDEGQALRLESCLGIPEELVRSIRRLEFGQAICGAVAVQRKPITAAFLQESDDPRAQLVKSLGIRVYVCHPLLAGDRLLGTLSFASRTATGSTTTRSISCGRCAATSPSLTSGFG